MDLLLHFLNVVVQLLEGVRRRCLVLLDVCLQGLKSVGQVLDVGPGSVGFRPFYLLTDYLVLREVSVVKVAVVAEEEGGKVEGEVRFIFLRGCSKFKNAFIYH